MAEADRATYLTRDTILKLLSDEEVAKISTAETASGLAVDAEYVDLEHIGKGVQRSSASTKITMGNVLPRSAVHESTWRKVVAGLAS